MNFEWVDRDNRTGLKLWDDFLMRSPRGHYCLLSAWLRSHESYGFDFGVLTTRENRSGPIIGGIGLLWFGNPVFRVMAAPIGPIVSPGFENVAQQIIENVLVFSKRNGASLLQLRFPCSSEAELPALLPPNYLPMPVSAHTGAVFNSGNAPDQMLWIGFPQGINEDKWRDELFQRFDAHTRRNINQAERQGIAVTEAKDESELREAFHIIERNGKQRGYSTRRWKDFGRTVIEQVSAKQAFMLTAQYKNALVGAHYGVVAGRRYSYIMGGTERIESLKTGHILHWSAMKKARDLNLLGYDFTSGGSPGVMRFKMGFRPDHIHFIEPRYYVFSEARYKVFNLVYPWARRHRGQISKILSVVFGALRTEAKA